MSPLSSRCATRELSNSRMAAMRSSSGVTRVWAICASAFKTCSFMFIHAPKFSRLKRRFSLSNPVFVQKSDPASNLQ